MRLRGVPQDRDRNVFGKWTHTGPSLCEIDDERDPAVGSRATRKRAYPNRIETATANHQLDVFSSC